MSTERDSLMNFQTKPSFYQPIGIQMLCERESPCVFPNQSLIFKPMGIKIVSGLVWKYIGLSLSLDIDSLSLYKTGHNFTQLDTSGYKWTQVDTSGLKWTKVDTSGHNLT